MFVLMNGQELKERRLKLKLTRHNLSNLHGLTQDSIWRWETNRLPFLQVRESAFEKIEIKFNEHKAARLKTA